MRVASEIMQHVLGAAERRLGIHNPVCPIKLAQEPAEVLLLTKRNALAKEPQLAARKKPSQSSNELPAKNVGEHLDREKEVGTRSDPPGIVSSEATSGTHAVDVRMWGEGLSRCATKGNPTQRQDASDPATSSSVPALASKSKENSCLLFCHINGTNSCGTLKTKW